MAGPLLRDKLIVRYFALLVHPLAASTLAIFRPNCRRKPSASQRIYFAAELGNLAMAQNMSHAVMAQRYEPLDSPDDFPTPPWATRALVEHVLGSAGVRELTCLEPACGRGHMARPLAEYFHTVDAADAYHYGFGPVRDFLTFPYESKSHDWVITNPPFRLAEEFVSRALSVARIGVAILARTVFLESVGRYESIFRDNPPSVFAQFAERVPMVKGRVDAKASTATGYAWFVWRNDLNASLPALAWVPPCRRKLERAGDYT